MNAQARSWSRARGSMRATFLALTAWSLLVAVGPARGEAPAAAPASPSLRDVFIASERTGDGERVGRLGIRLQTAAGWQAVSPLREFHAGDRFRFDVTTSRPAWIYLFHQSPAEAMKRLWPPAGAPPDLNRLRPGGARQIPDNGVFVFDEQAGDERFYVVLRATPSAPRPPASKPATKSTTKAATKATTKPTTTGGTQLAAATPVAAVAAATPGGGIVNFIVRGGLEEGGPRGVLYVPEEREADLNLYFAGGQTKAPGDAVLEVRLNHR